MISSPLSSPSSADVLKNPSLGGAALPNAAPSELLPITQNVVVGYGKLRALLQPQHDSLRDEAGDLKGFVEYHDYKTGKALFYPRVKTYSRRNPYRLHQLNSQCAGRSAAKMLKVAAVYPGMKVADVTLTCPKPISEYLAARGKSGINAAWGMEKRFWASMVENSLIGQGLARRVNLHTWKSELPVEPHYHLHELVPSYEQTGATEVKLFDICLSCTMGGKCIDDSGNFCTFKDDLKVIEKPELSNRPYKKLKSGGFGVWSDSELDRVKAIWLKVCLDFAVQHCIDAFQNQNELRRIERQCGIDGLAKLIGCLSRLKEIDAAVVGLIDVFVSYVKLETNGAYGKTGFIHKLAYNGRHPIEDYAYYSNKHLDCPPPPEFIANYSNKARVFGWWKRIDSLLKVIPEAAEVAQDEKLSPYTAEPLEYVGGMSVRGLLVSELPLMLVDFVRGKVIERPAGQIERNWLEGVVCRCTSTE